MGFFDDIGGVFDSVFDVVSGEGGGILGPLVNAGATIYSASTAADANRKAAETAARASAEQAAAIREANERADARYGQIREDAVPGYTYLRQVVADPNVLTAYQRQGLDELRDRTQRNLAASGLSGSGRAQVAAQRAVESDYVNRAQEANRGRAMTAAGQLAGPYFQAGGNQAVLERDTGRALGSAAEKSGLYAANAETANAALRGAALGDISAIIASEAKKGRESRYKPQRDQSEEAI